MSLGNLNALETSACPLCKSTEMSVRHIFGPFRVVSCRVCGLAYLSPRLRESSMRAAYENAGYFATEGDIGYADYRDQEHSLRITFRRFLEELKRQDMTNGRLLEIGSGYGFFLAEAEEFFSYVCGLELSPEAVAYAQNLSGATIYPQDVKSLPPEVKDFDVIVAINVIEHIYDPVDFVLHIKKRLKKAGKIIIATPDIGSFWYKIMGRKWPSFKVPEHVAFYTSKTLALLLERSGCGNIKPVSFPHAFPLELITRQFRIHLEGKFSKIPIWIPKTMLALSAESHGE